MKHNKKEYEQIVSDYKKRYHGDNIAFLLKDKPYNTIKKINEIKCNNPDRIISEYLPNDKIIIQDELFRKLLIDKGENIKTLNEVINEVKIKTDFDDKIIELIDNKTNLKIKLIDNNHKILSSKFFVSDDKFTQINDLIFNKDTNVIINRRSLDEIEFLKIISQRWIFQLNQETSIRFRIKRILELDDDKLIFKKRILPREFKDYFQNKKSYDIVDEIVDKHDLYNEDIYKALITKRLLSFLQSVFYDRLYNFLDFVNNKNNYNTLLNIVFNTKHYDQKIKFFCSFYCKIHSSEINVNKHKDFVNFYNNLCKKKDLPSLDLCIKTFNREVSPSKDNVKNVKLKFLTKGLILNEITNFDELKNYILISKIKPIDFLEYESKKSIKLKEIITKINDLLIKNSKLNPFIENIIYISKLHERDIYKKTNKKMFLYDLIFFKNPKLSQYVFNESHKSSIASSVNTNSFSQNPIAYLVKSIHDMVGSHKPVDIPVDPEELFNYFFAHIHENETNKPFFNLRNNPCMCAFLLLYFELSEEKTLYTTMLNSFIFLNYDMESIHYFLNGS